MGIFSKYFKDLMSQLGSQIKHVLISFKDFLVDLWHGISAGFSSFFDVTKHYISNFDVWSWILFILLVLLMLILIGGLIFFIVKLIMIRVKVKKRFSDREDLMNEIEDLNNKVLDLIDEKNKIMAMQVSKLGIKPGSKEAEELASIDKDFDKRFTKLHYVDEMYAKRETREMTEEEKIDLKTFAEKFRNYSAGQLNLFYTQKNINLFIASLGSSKIMILEGISGTGKTSLPYAFGMFINNKSSIISVQPSWRDRSELLGYLNEFTKKFNESEFLRELYRANYERPPRIIVLDEMNLARIEYYFAEFLSMLEMPNPDDRVIDLVSEIRENDPKYLVNGKLLVPRNVWFIGTANQDDSTFAVTDKVYDRASTIVLNKRADIFKAEPTEPVYMCSDYLDSLFEKATQDHKISEENLKKLEELEDFMISKFKIPFGNRIYKQINLFVPIYVACGGKELDGFDYIITRKILRKIASLHAGFVQRELREMVNLINKLFGRTEFSEAREFIEDFLKGV